MVDFSVNKCYDYATKGSLFFSLFLSNVCICSHFYSFFADISSFWEEITFRGGCFLLTESAV